MQSLFLLIEITDYRKRKNYSLIKKKKVTKEGRLRNTALSGISELQNDNSLLCIELIDVCAVVATNQN